MDLYGKLTLIIDILSTFFKHRDLINNTFEVCVLLNKNKNASLDVHNNPQQMFTIAHKKRKL